MCAPLALASVVVVALSLMACGSDDSSDAAAPAAEGKKATGEPIKIGFLNPDVGVGSIAEPGFAEEAAVGRINDVDDGINGRPLDVSVCHVDSTPEKNISCAERFVRQKVAAVVDGFDYGSGPALKILRDAGIPVVGPVAWNGQAETDPKAVYFGPSQLVYGVGPLVSFKEQGLKKVTFGAGDVPAGRAYIDSAIAPAAENLGLDFRAIYYPVGSPNFQSVASTIAATEADVGGLIGTNDEGQCTQIINAMRSVGFTESIFGGFCTRFIEALGPKAGEVQIYSHVWLPQMKDHAPPEIQEQLETAESDLNEVGDPEKQGFFTYATYAAFMTFADVLRTVKGPVDSTTIAAALANYKGKQAFLGPEITCDRTAWPKSSACSNKVMVAKLQSDGSLQPVGGDFTSVSPSVVSGE